MLSVSALWRRRVLRGVLGWGAAWLVVVGAAGPAGAQTVAPATGPLPPEVEAALARAKLPREALAVMVVDAQPAGKAGPRLSHRAQAPVNPASVMKLVTTYAALEQLGPAYVWNTPVYVQGTVQDGSLRGNVYIQGQGDPKLVMERLWLLMRRLQGQGHSGHRGRCRAGPQCVRRAGPGPCAVLMASRCGPTTPHPTPCCSTTNRR
jgi:D-alanyl-D-alanine carboxypeptidase/D-alanyl-D-alanine-endopeptidase (penicillin-binding protein 4)